LKKAAESSPEAVTVRFNYGLALFLNENYMDAATELRAVIAANPRDGEAYYLLAKTLEALKDTTAPAVDSHARTNLTAGNRYANLEKEWAKTKNVTDVPLRVEQPQRKDFVSVVLSRRNIATTAAAPAANETETLLAQARTQFKNGNDDDAMATVRRVLAGEPMSAESYLILGKIHLRRGDREQAVSAFKTAIFWNNRQIDAFINLGKIYLERGECLQVKNYSASAIELDAENPDAVALQRQAERCSK
jgi:Flp pilus assembly protein TadD